VALALNSQEGGLMSLKGFVVAVAGAMLVAGFTAAPALGQGATKPTAVSHDLEGRDQCLMCHTAGVMEPVPDVPESHVDRPNETCLWCHAQDAPMQTADPKPISHETAGREKCLMCHKAGAMEPVPDVPASHEPIAEQYCGLCHKKAGG
jgi:hypothetical protein